MAAVSVRVPATSANLGPGFDCLGLALDLWNEATFREAGEGIRLQIQGEGSGHLPRDGRNLIARAALRVYTAAGKPAPSGLEITCQNLVPLSSGLGSSAAASLTGLLGANALLGRPLSASQILELALAFEGHPDNVAPALYGSLVIAVCQDGCAGIERQPGFPKGENLLVQVIPIPALEVVVVVPAFRLSTRAARAALPLRVRIEDAVFNLGRTALVVEALRSGDLDLLGQTMEDRLHQPYRLKLIPGAEAALTAARQAGAAAAALSGAGPSVIAFPFSGRAAAVSQAMQAAFRAAGLDSRSFLLSACSQGAVIESVA
jgi:homoserine kinase